MSVGKIIGIILLIVWLPVIIFVVLKTWVFGRSGKPPVVLPGGGKVIYPDK